jgi:hypothetical protein
MYAYPKQAAVDRPISKAKIYLHAKPSKRIRELFVAQVADIRWKFKLSPETINLPANHGIQELQIIEVLLRVPELDMGVIQAIEKAIPFPLFLQLVYEDVVRYCASFKRPSESNASKWVIEAVFQTTWQSSECERLPLPVALDLSSLYEQMLRRHIPLQPRADEPLTAHIARFNQVQTGKKLQSQLQTKLSQERQFNRKVELNAQLRELTEQLTDLQR